jgi:hypothetical protein
VSAAVELFCNRRKRATHAARHRHATYYETAIPPGSITDVSESQEVKRFAFASALAAAAFRTDPSELDQSSLFGMEPQSELFHPPL